MKSLRFRFVAAALAVLLGTVIAHSQTTEAQSTTTAPAAPAHHAMHRHALHPARYGMRFFPRSLNLTEAQHEQIRSIMQKERPTLQPLMQQLHQSRQQLHQYEEGTYDEAKVRAVATQVAQTQAELMVQQTRIHNEMFQVLTPDQQAQMKQIEANRAARMQERMNKAPAAPAAPEN